MGNLERTFGTYTRDKFLQGSGYKFTNEKLMQRFIGKFLSETYIGACVSTRKVGKRWLLEIPTVVYTDSEVMAGILEGTGMSYADAINMYKTSLEQKEKELYNYLKRQIDTRKGQKSATLFITLYTKYTTIRGVKGFDLTMRSLKFVLKQINKVKGYSFVEYCNDRIAEGITVRIRLDLKVRASSKIVVPNIVEPVYELC